MATRSHGYQPGLRPSSTQAQPAVTASMAVMATRANTVCRSRHSAAAPMPVSAPTAGASATV